MSSFVFYLVGRELMMADSSLDLTSCLSLSGCDKRSAGMTLSKGSSTEISFSVKEGTTNECSSVSIDVSKADTIKLSRKRGSPEYPVLDLLTKKCCSRSSVTCFTKLSVADIEGVRSEFYALSSETDQNQYVINYMRRHSDCSGSLTSVMFTIAGKVVCQQCWRLAHGIKYTRFRTMVSKFEKGVLQIEHGRQGRLSVRVPKVRAAMWLRMFVEKVGDRMPTDGSIHLPSCLTKVDVYDLAQHDLGEGGIKVCSRSTFFQLWKSDFSHVKIPPENRFTSCDVCSAIREARMRTMDPVVRKWLTQVMEKHSELVMTEREKYTKHQHKAEKQPGSYMSIIIDGMDQAKTALPHIPSNPKSLAGQFTLPTHLTGVHAHGRLTLILTDWGEFPHDSNLTINVLLQMFLRYKETLPPTLYLQLDNTCRENKNKYVLTFLALLVELGVFRKVKVGFLPVGHTHEDIDRIFSCISRGIRHKTILTVPELLTTTKKTFTPTPETMEIKEIYDVKEWMSKVTPPIHDHLKAHQFRFVKVSGGTTRLFYKQWSTDELWLPPQGISILEGVAQSGLPTGVPNLVHPSLARDDLQKLTTTITKVAGYLEKSGAKQWWAEWLQQAEQICESSNPLQTCEVLWPLQALQKRHQGAPCVHLENTHVTQSPALSRMSTRQEHLDIPGVGEVPLTWIGQVGQRRMGRLIEQEELRPIVKGLQQDLRVLASSCLHAMNKLGAEKSMDTQVTSAVQLCKQYCNTSEKSKPCKATRIAELWKEHSSHTCAPDDRAVCVPQGRAADIVGEKIVEIITEKNKEPPDIYIGPSRSTVIQNRDVVKDLSEGMLVAIDCNNFPQIGKVQTLHPNAHLDSPISVEWLQQEKNPTKPRWLRFFKPSKGKQPPGTITYNQIILYDFQLTPCGALKKKSRDYLQSVLKKP